MKEFTDICRKSQKGLKRYVAKQLKETHSDITNGDGFVYAQGTFPVLLVAHLDTVHKVLPNEIVFDINKGALYSNVGIGGDDRCGVYMILEIIKRFNCSVLFCEDEEIGGIGAKKFTRTDLAKELEFNYIIEFDRRGKNDAVFYDCDNDEFKQFITKEFYESSWGTFSDISILAPFLKCAAVNLSCGYYKAHTNKEYVVIAEMEKSIEEACKILGRTTEDNKFEYIEAVYSYSGWNGGSWKKYFEQRYGVPYEYEDEDDDDCFAPYNYGGYSSGCNSSSSTSELGEYYYLIEYADGRGVTHWYDLYANTTAEAVGKFLMRFPDTTYNDIIDICSDRNDY